jgi:hypothetical protein
MTEPKFDDVLDVWVAKQNAWTLFDAVCLLLHIDPDKRKEPILLEVDDGQTTRYFKYSLEGAGTCKNYKILKENPDEVGAKRYLVDGKAFIEWATKRWPDEALHLKDALLRYKLKKGTLSKTAIRRRSGRNQAFQHPAIAPVTPKPMVDGGVQVQIWRTTLLRRPRAGCIGGPRAPVAQLDRALPSEGRGHKFESCRVHQ